MAFPVPAISPAWSLFCQRALIQHKSFTHTHTHGHILHTFGKDSHIQRPYVCPQTRKYKHKPLATRHGPTLHSLIDAAKVFILSVCFYSAQFICMLWDPPAETWALNEHPLQFCCQLRQPGQTTWMGGDHRLRIWIRDGSSAWLASPWLLLLSPNMVQIGYCQAKFECLFWKSTKPVRQGLKMARLMQVTQWVR